MSPFETTAQPPPVHSQPLCLHSPETVFANYLLRTPFSHALFRAAEAVALVGVPLPGPVLDLGCGAGEFAAFALDGRVEAGVDISAKQLRHAARTGRYDTLCRADARQLPFPDGVFRTVLSLSVLEHIESPAAAAAEAFRVLVPGGRFVGTVVLEDLHHYLYYPALCRRLGFVQLEKAYRRWQDHHFRHRTILPAIRWQQILAKVGFEVITSLRAVSPAVTMCWDRYLPAALPYLLFARLGHPLVWHTDQFRSWARRCAAKLLAAPSDEGSVLAFIAEKPLGGEMRLRG